MPNYTARQKKTGKLQQLSMTIAEMEQWEKDNPKWEVLCGAPILGYNVYSVTTPSNAFGDKLRAIKEANPKSPMQLPNRGDI